jgi:hypothetical protein
MAERHQATDDVIYDLVSIQYRALNGAQLYERFLGDAGGHEDVQQFFRQCAQEDARRANQCHELIGELTGASAARADRGMRARSSQAECASDERGGLVGSLLHHARSQSHCSWSGAWMGLRITLLR